jgi:two-component system sensor histidine kinase UhpB
MNRFPTTAWTPLAPLKVFVLVLLTTFAVEGCIMFLLQYLPHWWRTQLAQGFIDASILTLVMAPIIWWLVVKPLRRLSDSRRELLYAFLEAQELERSRIARDLHDEIGQQLTALLVGLGTLECTPDLLAARKLAHDLRQVGATAHEEVRRLARGLHPGVLEDLGLVAAVERLCEDFEQAHGVGVQLEASATIGLLPLSLELTLYRILQESLTNVARHAQASSVKVSLDRIGKMITLSVADDGRGLQGDPNELSKPGNLNMGLKSIRERAEMLHGDCFIRSVDRGGTLIEVRVPLLEEV